MQHWTYRYGVIIIIIIIIIVIFTILRPVFLFPDEKDAIFPYFQKDKIKTKWKCKNSNFKKKRFEEKSFDGYFLFFSRNPILF